MNKEVQSNGEVVDRFDRKPRIQRTEPNNQRGTPAVRIDCMSVSTWLDSVSTLWPLRIRAEEWRQWLILGEVAALPDDARSQPLCGVPKGTGVLLMMANVGKVCFQ